jgi:hypothetical protein
MNEDEIERALDIINQRAPAIAPYAKFLADWRDTVNANSDGWSSWHAGRRAADRLSALVTQTLNWLRGQGEAPTPSELKSALEPIRATATRHKLSAPSLFPSPAGGRS